MALTPSTMLPLGTRAPQFNLIDTISDKKIQFDQVKGTKGTLVAFICNHCPYVIHINPVFIPMAHQMMEQGIGVVAISSNDIVNYPQDAPGKMQEFARIHQLKFPYLFDESQEVAKAYQAACTPDLYLFDNNNELIYRGQFDDSTPGKGTADGSSLKLAVDALLDNKPPLEQQNPSVGCNIKWLN